MVSCNVWVWERPPGYYSTESRETTVMHASQADIMSKIKPRTKPIDHTDIKTNTQNKAVRKKFLTFLHCALKWHLSSCLISFSCLNTYVFIIYSRDPQRPWVCNRHMFGLLINTQTFHLINTPAHLLDSTEDPIHVIQSNITSVQVRITFYTVNMSLCNMKESRVTFEDSLLLPSSVCVASRWSQKTPLFPGNLRERSWKPRASRWGFENFQ